ncbi:hypothetical protein PGT21_020220 [Puccinia graminis f. sp. tritici]|uniref:Uncharacterized protein n=1 Tax=Puccinia graminis f. sp. tritici TaxID=56615 RepID=A0A5B0QTJ0_PUCGR|nr:hypothetical protein PGT21_020220 [Puccinia graminis f. sp. tritici]
MGISHARLSTLVTTDININAAIHWTVGPNDAAIATMTPTFSTMLTVHMPPTPTGLVHINKNL